MPSVTVHPDYPKTVVLTNGGRTPITEPITGQRIRVGDSATIVLEKPSHKQILERSVDGLNRVANAKLSLDYPIPPKPKNNLYQWQTDNGLYAFTEQAPRKLCFKPSNAGVATVWNNYIQEPIGDSSFGVKFIIPQADGVAYLNAEFASPIDVLVKQRFMVDLIVRESQVTGLLIKTQGETENSLVDVLPLLNQPIESGSILQLVRNRAGEISLIVNGQKIESTDLHSIVIGGMAAVVLRLLARDSNEGNMTIPPDIYIEKVKI